jgi:hypothetical protein
MFFTGWTGKCLIEHRGKRLSIVSGPTLQYA